jgi:hypothetical protein
MGSRKASKDRALWALGRPAAGGRWQARLRDVMTVEWDAGRARRASDFLALLGVGEHRRKGVEWADKPRSRLTGVARRCTKLPPKRKMRATLGCQSRADISSTGSSGRPRRKSPWRRRERRVAWRCIREASAVYRRCLRGIHRRDSECTRPLRGSGFLAVAMRADWLHAPMQSHRMDGRTEPLEPVGASATGSMLSPGGVGEDTAEPRQREADGPSRPVVQRPG